MIAAGSGTTDIWSFVSVFDWTLWLALFATMVGVGLALYAVELLSLKRHTPITGPGAAASTREGDHRWQHQPPAAGICCTGLRNQQLLLLLRVHAGATQASPQVALHAGLFAAAGTRAE
jgi:hypothetical protein